MGRSRFAPTTSGPAHPGTLLAALLAWLDARSRGDEIGLRLEDVDPARCTPAHAEEMRAALAWLGLDWDRVEVQTEARARHEAALDRVAGSGRLYACSCSRAAVALGGVRAPDGAWRYRGTCRAARVGAADWRGADAALRVRLDGGPIALRDESGLDLGQDPEAVFGDPVVRRRDGAIAYHWAAVVDDGAAGTDRIVRGRDLATTTATQVALQRLLDLPTPRYRHHFLLLEERGGKLAKLHGAVGWRALAERYSAEALCGLLSYWAGLADSSAPLEPRALVARFDWARVRPTDRVVRWDGAALTVGD